MTDEHHNPYFRKADEDMQRVRHHITVVILLAVLSTLLLLAHTSTKQPIFYYANCVATVWVVYNVVMAVYYRAKFAGDMADAVMAEKKYWQEEHDKKNKSRRL